MPRLKFHLPILDQAGAYKDIVHKRREVQTRDKKKSQKVYKSQLAIQLYLPIPEI